MAQTIRAVFSQRVFKPEEPVNLPENARVRLIVEPSGKAADDPESNSFFDACRAVANTGVVTPADFSENVDAYLYGGKALSTP